MENSIQPRSGRKHPVLDLVVIGPILLALWGELCYVLPGVLATAFLPESVAYFVVAALGAVAMVIHWCWFRDEFRGGFSTRCLGERKLWVSFLALLLLDGLYFFVLSSGGFGAITAEDVGSGLAAGVCEDASARYILLSAMMRRYKDRKSCLPALLFSSAIFGLSHYINMDSMADFVPVSMQVIITICSGIAMGALFLRTGNIALPIVWHFLHDLLCSSLAAGEAAVAAAETAAAETASSGVTAVSLLQTAVLCAIYIVFAVFLLKGQNETIAAVWNEQWPGVSVGRRKAQNA